jgi:hypothetical protein
MNLQLPPQSRDVHIDGPWLHKAAWAPYLIQELLAPKNLSCLRGQSPEQRKLDARKPDLPSLDPNFIAETVQAQHPDDNLVLSARFHTP